MDTGWADMVNQQENRQGDRGTDTLTREAWQSDMGGDRVTRVAAG